MYVLNLWQVRATLIRTWKISRSTWEKFPVTSTLSLVRSGCPNYQGMPVSHPPPPPPYVIACFKTVLAIFFEEILAMTHVFILLLTKIRKSVKVTDHRVLTYIEHCVSLSTQILCITGVFKQTQTPRSFNSIFLLFSYKLGQTSTRIMVNFKNIFKVNKWLF